MKLVKAQITKYKSIIDSTPVDIEDDVTVLVGINEAGKSAFLESLYKAAAVLGEAEYRDISDYPRKDWSSYKRKKGEDNFSPSQVAELTFKLDRAEIDEIAEDVGKGVLDEHAFTKYYRIDNTSAVSFYIDEKPFVERLLESSGISDGLKEKLSDKYRIHELLEVLGDQKLTGVDKEFFDELEEKFTSSDDDSWSTTRLSKYIYFNYLSGKIPKFLYFSDYNILPGKINIPYLKKAKANGTIDGKHKTALGLLEMANVSIEELENPDSYEDIKAELEAISLDISNRVFKYWKQNKKLSVEFDVKEDTEDDPPYNTGPNLYIRVKNIEHGVSVPFDQRSKGFVWFFSFIVWFNSVKDRIETEDDVILLLDEPGLSLHGLAQADFLHYINDLSKDQQILYTTHSPFMIDGEKLNKVRTVEDIQDKGTIVSGDLSSSDKRTLFPLQAGLGYTIAQNLFIGKKNALVEGPADLLYWRFFSNLLEPQGKGLDDEVVIVPTGGLDKIATFISLLAGNELDIAVVHDFNGSSEQRLDDLVRQKILKDKQITNYARFRDSNDSKPKNSDVEDMFDEKVYLDLFNKTFSKELNGKKLHLKDLPKDDRIVRRIERYLDDNGGISLRPSGGFNHYAVANFLVSNPLTESQIGDRTLERFSDMFAEINSLLK